MADCSGANPAAPAGIVGLRKGSNSPLGRKKDIMATWNIDTVHSAIHFSVRHMVVSKTRGRFAKWSGQIDFDPADPLKAKVSVDIDPASIDTADAQRDGHLRSADFFDVEKFPQASFRSTRVEEL